MAKEKTNVTEQASPQERAAIPSTLDGIIATLAALRPGFGDAVSALSAQLIAEASKLAELRQEVEQEQQQLATLHGLEVTETTLTQLIQEYRGKSTAFAAETQQRQTTFEQAMAELRKTWQREQDDHARVVKERDAATKKTEERETTEYTYNLEHRRKLENDAYAQEREKLEKALQDFAETKKKAWADREKRIAEQEKEYVALQAKVEKFPKELEIAVKKAKEESAVMALRQAKTIADVRAKEAEGERRIYELKIQALEETITTQQQQLKNLAAQLDAALRQAQDLAMKAIEGASSTGSLLAVKEIALEQAKNAPKNR